MVDESTALMNEIAADIGDMETVGDKERNIKTEEKFDNVENTHNTVTPDHHESLKAKHAFDPAF